MSESAMQAAMGTIGDLGGASCGNGLTDRQAETVKAEFARRIEQAGRTYSGVRPAQYRRGLASAVALCTTGQEWPTPYRQGSPKFQAYETGWEDGMNAWADLHPDDWPPALRPHRPR